MGGQGNVGDVRACAPVGGWLGRRLLKVLQKLNYACGFMTRSNAPNRCQAYRDHDDVHVGEIFFRPLRRPQECSADNCVFNVVLEPPKEIEHIVREAFKASWIDDQVAAMSNAVSRVQQRSVNEVEAG